MTVQRPVSGLVNEVNGVNADIVFVIEDTSNLYSHFNGFKHSYLQNLLKQFCPLVTAPSNGGMFGEYRVQQFGLVLYRTNAPGTLECVSCFPPTHDLTVFHNQMKDIKFEGGGVENNAFVVEGMGVALEIFDDMDQSRINKTSKISKICVIMGQSTPYLVPCHLSQKYTGFTCEKLAKMMLDNDIKLSVLAPRRNDDLKKIFDAGGPEDSSLRDYGVDPSHMILVSGWELPVQEQTDPNILTKQPGTSPHSPAKKGGIQRKANTKTGGPGSNNPPSVGGTWVGSPHRLPFDSPLGMNTPSPRGGIMPEQPQLHAPDVPMPFTDQTGQQRMPNLAPNIRGGPVQPLQRMPAGVVMMQNHMIPQNHMVQQQHPGMRQPGQMVHPNQQIVQGNMMQPGVPPTSHDNFQQQQSQQHVQHSMQVQQMQQRQMLEQQQQQQQLQQMQQQQVQQQQQQQQVQQQQQQVQQQQQQATQRQQVPHQIPPKGPPKRTVVWNGRVECWASTLAGRPTQLAVQFSMSIEDPSAVANTNLSSWPDKATLEIIRGTNLSQMKETKKACKLLVTPNPNNDKQQDNAKNQIEVMLTEEPLKFGLLTVTLNNMIKEQVIMFMNNKNKIIIGLYPINQSRFQEEIQSKMNIGDAAQDRQPQQQPQQQQPQQQQPQPQQQQQQMPPQMRPQQMPPGARMQHVQQHPGGNIQAVSNPNMIQHLMQQQQQMQQQQNPRMIRPQGTVQMMTSAPQSQMNSRMQQMAPQQMREITLQQMQQYQQMRQQRMPNQMQGSPMQQGQNMQANQMQSGQSMQPGQMQPGQVQGQMQGQMPGQMQGQMPGQMSQQVQSQMVQQGNMQMRMGQAMNPISRNDEVTLMQHQQHQMQLLMQQQNRGGMNLQQQQQIQQQMQNSPQMGNQMVIRQQAPQQQQHPNWNRNPK